MPFRQIVCDLSSFIVADYPNRLLSKIVVYFACDLLSILY